MRFFFISLVLLFVGSCALLKGAGEVVALKSPQISLKKVDLTRITLDGVNSDFYFSIYNPNSITVRLVGFEFNAFLNNEDVASGMLKHSVKIDADATKELIIPIYIPFSGLTSGTRSAIIKKTVVFNIKGYATVNTPLGKLKFKVIDKTNRVL